MIRSRATDPVPLQFEYIEVTDPAERARIQARQERAKRNNACWNAHALQFGQRYRGKHICIAGAEFFVADSALDAQALGAAAHPEDDSRFVMYIPKEKMVRIYANRRAMAGVR